MTPASVFVASQGAVMHQCLGTKEVLLNKKTHLKMQLCLDTQQHGSWLVLLPLSVPGRTEHSQTAIHHCYVKSCHGRLDHPGLRLLAKTIPR